PAAGPVAKPEVRMWTWAMRGSVGESLGRGRGVLRELSLHRLPRRQLVAGQAVEIGLAGALVKHRSLARFGAEFAPLGPAQVIEFQHGVSPSWSIRIPPNSVRPAYP